MKAQPTNVLVNLLMAVAAAVSWALGPPALAGERRGPRQAEDLVDLDIEELMALDVRVTSVAKKPQKLSEAPAAVYVITAEDIRRSGATSIPEALRMVPGLHVARIDASKWAISARGFTDKYANKLLVMIDGRTVYTPAFGGTFWDVQDTLLEDIERIEVIRGPGAALWGANAVNGVISIVTKSARDTQGGLVTGGFGTEERAFGGFRYGGKLGERAYYRVYAKCFDRDGSVDGAGHHTQDDWHAGRFGFRMDWDLSTADLLTVQGDYYKMTSGETLTIPTLTPPYERIFDDTTYASGHYILARWQHTLSATSDMALQFYYSRTERTTSSLDECRDTLDLDFQHRFALGERHSILWGLGFRRTSDHFDNLAPLGLSFLPDERDDNLFSAFVQDEIALVRDRLVLTVGSKFEHNDYTGFEVQPSARLLWTPHPRHTLWAAASRAVRTPSRDTDDLRFGSAAFPLAPSGTPAVLTVFGDRGTESEELAAYELGYRVKVTDRLSLDVAAFYNDYRNLITAEAGAPFMEMSPAPPHLIIPLVYDNKMDGETYGVEVAAECDVTERWKLRAGYSFLNVRLHPHSSSTDTRCEEAERRSPHNQFHIRSFLDLPGNLELDTALYYVDSLPTCDVGSYVRVDARLAWRPRDGLEVALTLQNLLDAQHREFTERTGTQAREFQRAAYLSVRCEF